MKPTIKEFEIKDYPSNFQIFINDQCFHYPTDGQKKLYTEDEYYDYCWNTLTYLIDDIFDPAPDKIQEIVKRIMFYLGTKDFFKEIEMKPTIK